MTESTGLTRRALLKRLGVGGAGLVSARGAYAMLEELAGPERAQAALVRRRQEQYLVDGLEVILDNGVTAIVPPIYNDVITARLTARKTWTPSALQKAASRLEKALKAVEAPYSATAAGLTIMVGWGLPYFRSYVASPWAKRAPKDLPGGQLAVLDAIRFPSDPDDLVLEANHVAFKLRSDSQDILRKTERALFDDPASGAYVGDLLDVTSKRIGFIGRGFGGRNVGKELAVANGVPGAASIPDRSQLMMGFTSSQPAALGPNNIVSFETLPKLTDQWPGGYFAAGCAMHLSHLRLDLASWYAGDYASRVGRMFSPHTPVPSDPATVTLSNGPADVTSRAQLDQDVSGGSVGHNGLLQQVTRLNADVVDNYGRLRPKGTAVPIREDFNTIDNPFAWPASGLPAAAGLHFAVHVPASRLFHTARLAMDGVLPDTNLRGTIDDAHNGINSFMAATHRQNFLVPPRAHRSLPLAEML
jgi:hypothetical protein